MNKFFLFFIALGLYLVWVFATYILEGRIELLHRNDPFARIIYTVITNMVIGTVIAFIFIKHAISSTKEFVTLKQLGFRSTKYTVALIAITGSVGFALFLIQHPASLNSIVIINVFLQTLPGSIAEVMVCWTVVGVFSESLSKGRLGKLGAISLGIIVSTVLFGTYHFAHSSPFNQPNTVIFLMLPGLLTSIVYFVGRNVYATIVFHNFQALFGVMASVQTTTYLLNLQYPVLILAVVSVLSLVGSSKIITKINGS
ncbi:MAG: CPBP family glutamic-type intramembrane protease [Candidatus Nitrosocosmicus sp.]